MEKQEKKSEVKQSEKEVTVTSSYVKISDLGISDIRSFNKGTAIIIPKIGKTSKSYTYEFTLHKNGLIINPLGDNARNRENLSLDEFNLIRLNLGKFDSYFLNHSFETNCYYRLVKGEQEDGSKYYSVQYWLTPNGRCHTHFFSQTELSLMVSLKKAGKANFIFIEKPKDIVEDEIINIENNNDLDIL